MNVDTGGMTGMRVRPALSDCTYVVRILEPLGKVVGSIGTVVVDDDDVHGVVQERPDGVVLQSLATAHQVQFSLCGDERREVVVVKGIWVNGVFFPCAHRMNLVNKRGQILRQAAESVYSRVDWGNRYTCFIEEV